MTTLTLQRNALLLVCLFAGLVCSSEEPKSCTYTQSTFDSLTVLNANGASTGLTGRIFDNFQSDSSPSVCQLGQTCCSGEAEQSLKSYITNYYRDKIITKLSDHLMGCHNHSFFSSFKEYVVASKDNLVSAMRGAYGIYFTQYVNIFDKFYNYLVSTIENGNTCNIATEWNEVFYEVYLAAYFTSPSTRSASQLPGTPQFRQCFFELFSEDESEFLAIKLNGFLRTFNQTMRYLRALRRLDSVIVSTVDYVLKQECQTSIMKMTHCASCAGYIITPCNDLCMNIMRGCLVDLSDVLAPLEEFSDALIKMEESISERNGLYYLWGQMDNLHSSFFQMISATLGNAANIETELLTRCNANGRTGPSKRQAPSGGARLPRVTVPAPIATLNHSAYCVAEALPYLSELPTSICTSELTGGGSCWNGKTVGSYGRAVLDFNRESQINNPELVIKQRQRHFEQQIANLEVSTREMNILTNNYQCGTDDEDEDCVIPPTCDYYNLVDVPVVIPEYSGSGSSSGDMPTTTTPVTTPPQTTVSDTTETPSESTTTTEAPSPTGPGEVTGPIATGTATGPGETEQPTGSVVVVEGMTTGKIPGGINDTLVGGGKGSATTLSCSLVSIILLVTCSVFLL